jgi:hypothetical protein
MALTCQYSTGAFVSRLGQARYHSRVAGSQAKYLGLIAWNRRWLAVRKPRNLPRSGSRDLFNFRFVSWSIHGPSQQSR